MSIIIMSQNIKELFAKKNSKKIKIIRKKCEPYPTGLVLTLIILILISGYFLIQFSSKYSKCNIVKLNLD